MTAPMRESFAVMGTVVTVHIVDPSRGDAKAAIARAAHWFRIVEQHCSRFDRNSEVQRLARTPGVAVPVSEILFEAVQFAVQLAEETGGAFDPAVGGAMEARGFATHYQTGERVTTPGLAADATFRDIELDAEARTIRLRRPLLLDLGAVAKGLAVDLAAGELAPFTDFAIDAGGDLRFGGRNGGREWRAGIADPFQPGAVVAAFRVGDAAVCTTARYERGEHIVDARDGATRSSLASVTVIAPSAMVADALATAAFVLGTDEGHPLLARHAVESLLITSDGRRLTTGALLGAGVAS
jgi:FAD:protein FMN transferase